MKPFDINSITYLDLAEKLMVKTVNLKSVILLGHQNEKAFLKKDMFQIGPKNFLWLKKLKILCRGDMLLVI